MSALYDLGVLKHFGTGNYIGRLDIAQKFYEFYQFFLYDFVCPKLFE